MCVKVQGVGVVEVEVVAVCSLRLVGVSVFLFGVCVGLWFRELCLLDCGLCFCEGVVMEGVRYSEGHVYSTLMG